MRVLVDGRAAAWYQGTGMGAYTAALVKHLPQLCPEVEFVGLPCGEASCGGRGDCTACDSLPPACRPTTLSHFWEALAAAPLSLSESAGEVLPSESAGEPPPSVSAGEALPSESAGEPPPSVSAGEVLPSERVGILHLPNNGFGCDLAELPAGVAFVPTVHDLIPYILPETVGSGYRELFCELMPQIVAAAERIIVPSVCTERDLLQRFRLSPERLEVIHEGVAPSLHPLPEAEVSRFLAARYSLEPGYILYLGGFSARKNVDGLLTAMSRLRHSLPGRRLVIVGRQDFRQAALRQQAASLGLGERVLWLPAVPAANLPFLYNGAAVFAYPSFYEGFGLPPLEAMACGTPTVIGDTPALTEIAGDGALAVDPHEPAASAEATLQICRSDQLAASLRRRGLRRASLYSQVVMAEKTASLYRNIQKNNDNRPPF